MAEIEDGECKEEEETTVAKGPDSELELVEEDRDAGEFMQFALPTQGWAKEMCKQLGLPAGLDNPYLPTEPMTPASVPRTWAPQQRISIEPDGCCFFRCGIHVLCGKDNRKGEQQQLHVSMRHRIQQLWVKVYGPDIKWVKGVSDQGGFPMTEEEWDALFHKANGWATISVIRLAATLLNCRIFTYTPVEPVDRLVKVAPNAAWIWKGVTPVLRYTTHPPCTGAIYLFNEGARHYMPIYSTGTIAQQVARQEDLLHQVLASNRALQMEVGGLKAEFDGLKKMQKQVKPPLIRRKYVRRAPLPQLQAGAVDAAHPPQPSKKRRKLNPGAAASVSCAAESASLPPPAVSAPQPPPENNMTREGVEAILATLRLVLVGMETMSAVRQDEVAKLRALPQTHDGAMEQAQPGASNDEVFNVFVLSFVLLVCFTSED